MRNRLIGKPLIAAALLVACAIVAKLPTCQAVDAPIDAMSQHNIVWNSPSADAKGSMPIGNGDIGLNVWVEPSGDLVFFIGKTDAWDENMRLLKLGKIRVKYTPSLVQLGKPFEQTLQLTQGRILIKSAAAEVAVWVDANYPVIQVDSKSLTDQPVEARVSFQIWRKSKRSLGAPVSGGGNEYFSTGYTSLPAISYPDTVLTATPQRIGWYHRNVDSPWLPSLKLQKLSAIAKTEKDPILNRTMGAVLRGDRFVAASNTELRTDKPARETSLRIHVLTQIADSSEQWLAALEKQANATEAIPAEKRWQRHCQWWNNFWNRSWIFVNGKRSLPVNERPWRVGVASDGGSRFGGTIVGARVIRRVLSADEIAQLAGQPRPAETKLGVDPITTACTIVAWVKPSAGESGRILDKCTAGTADGLLFDTHPGLSLRWLVGNATLVHPKCLKPGQWQHVAATADASTGVRRLYLNGRLAMEARNDSPAETVTRGYILQRWINACGGRGAFPIKFNGSIFVVDNRFDADYRAWGGGYWLQNTRLPYWSMLTAGDFDLMRPLFAMYMRALPARKLATKNYYGHAGAFYPETMSFFGNYLDQGDLGYGLDRAGKPDGLTDNHYIRREWQGGIELVALMLDYYDLTRDATFRDTTLLPFAAEIVTFFDQHWKRGSDGKILFQPSQALETWWDCTNPTPEVAGLRYVIPRLQRLTGDERHRVAWQKTIDDLPPVPLRADDRAGTFVLPAEKFASHRNYENPELYGVFPYRLYTLANAGNAVDVGKSTWLRRHGGNGGWHQDAIHAAMLGLADEARHNIVASASVHAEGFRFPAMWGPNYDWTPDQDHGSVMASALQRMLVQYEGDRILVLPAWPKDWDVSFKLHAPQNTTVEGIYRAGKLELLKVMPESRKKDVAIREPQGK